LKVISKIEDMTAFSHEARRPGKTIALVPTMGALHRGHLTLVEEARRLADIVILTIFVNPTQFCANEDLASYPRELSKDIEKAESAGVDVVFTPGVKAMYPEGFLTRVSVRGLEDKLCGLTRPGHFTGVATVVLKLFNITTPHIALFGEKDFQQLLVIRRMVSDLNLDIDIRGVETVREADGLAMSSRNSYLSSVEREAASALPRALAAARRSFNGGERAAPAIIKAVRGVLTGEKLIEIEYVKAVDAQSLEDLASIGDGNRGDALVQVAVKIGRARLIDHILL